MDAFFRIEMLPAQHGDALWIKYGTRTETHRILMDGGPIGTYPALAQRLDQVPVNERVFDLIVLTHVDADHVEGLVRLFADQPLPFKVNRVLFNGWRQMQRSHGLLGPLQGEFLSALLTERVQSKVWSADNPPLCVLNQGSLPIIPLPGGMKLTLLSPTPRKLQIMAKEWSKDIVKAGFAAGDLRAAWKLLAQKKRFLPKKGLLGTTSALDALVKQAFHPDQATANGSSLAFLAEYAGKSALLLGDAHPEVVATSLKRLCRERKIGKLDVNVVKLSHHGSKNNTDESLLALLSCPRYLISSNGAHFKHPDRACIARVIKFGHARELVFNYRSPYTRQWLTAAAQRKYGYAARVRDDKEPGIASDLFEKDHK